MDGVPIRYVRSTYLGEDETCFHLFEAESAQQVADLRADSRLQARLDELADKSTDGTLTEDERSEYDTYVRALDFIAVLQSKARASIGRATS